MNSKFSQFIATFLCLCLTAMSVNISYANSPVYNFAGILPIVKDEENQNWLYFGVEYKIKEPQLAILGGAKERKDKTAAETAIRELNEESLNVLEDYININNLEKLSRHKIDYHLMFLFNIKLYLTPIDFKLQNTKSCEYFLTEYKHRRLDKPEHYKKLAKSQQESYEIRRVKVSDLIKFLESPEKNDYKLTSYGYPDCTKPTPIKLRWSSRVLLQNQPALKKIL